MKTATHTRWSGSARRNFPWEIDEARSWVEFAVRPTGRKIVRGRFRGVRGWAILDADDITHSTITVEIDARTLDLGERDRDDVGRGPALLDVRSFPAIVLQSRKVARSGPGVIGMEADLTVRGRTGRVELDVFSRGPATDSDAEASVRFSASCVLDAREFGLDWTRLLGRTDPDPRHDVAVEADVVFRQIDPGPSVA